MKIIIPARYQSTRLPGKPVKNIDGVPMIVRVLKQAAKVAAADQVIVACDDERIFDAVEQAGGTAVMTCQDHQSGTDRIADALSGLSLPDDEIILNVQGDEPFIPVDLIQMTADALRNNQDAHISTCVTPIVDKGDIINPNVVKAVMDDQGRALYFSRAPIPFDRDGLGTGHYFRHIGIYGYRYHALKTMTTAPVHPLEALEKLEQLRALGLGMTIQVGVYQDPVPHGVDTEADLQAAIEYAQAHRQDYL